MINYCLVNKKAEIIVFMKNMKVSKSFDVCTMFCTALLFTMVVLGGLSGTSADVPGVGLKMALVSF